MSTTPKITIEELAVKLNGKMWTKGDLKRIYLDRGYNTKKMSTKTYVFEKDGEFIVVCNVECDNQPMQWCDSQKEQVIESVEKEIEEATKIIDLDEVLYAVFNTKTNSFVDDCGTSKDLNQLYEDDVYKFEKSALRFINDQYESDDLCVKKITRKDIE